MVSTVFRDYVRRRFSGGRPPTRGRPSHVTSRPSSIPKQERETTRDCRNLWKVKRI